MAINQFRQDLKVKLPGEVWEKATLTITPYGDLELIDGGEKLSVQLLRAVINDQAIGKDLMNKKIRDIKKLNVLISLVLRNFRQNQIDEVKRSDPDFSGYVVYRKAAGTNDQYERISTKAIEWKYIDTNLENGIQYDYGFSKIFRNTLESAFTEKMSATPSQFSSKQTIVIGREVAAIPSDEQITFYFNANRKFKGSELLDKIISTDVRQDTTEPRKVIVDVVVQDLRGNKIDLSTYRNFGSK